MLLSVYIYIYICVPWRHITTTIATATSWRRLLDEQGLVVHNPKAREGVGSNT